MESIGQPGGLVEDIFIIMLSSIIITNGINFFNPWWADRLRRRKNFRKEAEADPEGHTINETLCKE
jgi:hypothetical protein